MLRLTELLQTFSGYNGSNAFTGGYLQFAAVGADTQVQVDNDGGANSFLTLATLKGRKRQRRTARAARQRAERQRAT